MNTTSQSCILLDNLPANQGADLKNGTIKECLDTICVDCRENHKECVKCKNTDYTLIDNRCTVIDTSLVPPKVQSIAYSTVRSTAEVLFDQPIKLQFKEGTSQTFRVTVEDQITLKNYDCKLEVMAPEDIKCLVSVSDRSIRVLVSTELQITKGRLLVVPVQEADSKIQSRFTNQVFTQYPIIVEGYSSDKPKSLILAAEVLGFGNQAKPYTGYMLAGISLPASVLLDKYLVNLEYLALLEGPLLMYPQQVFEVVIKFSNYLPLYLLPNLDQLMYFRSLSDCQPSDRFAQQEYECSVLGNTGPDTYAVILLAIFCVVFTVACNKLIELRMRTWKFQEQADLKIPTEPSAPVIIPGSPKKILAKPSSVIIHSSSRPLRMKTKKLTQATITSKDALNSRSEQQSLETPSGEVNNSQHPSRTVRLVSNLKEVYGLGFLIVKLEANQLKLILVIFLNYWYYNKGSLEQYSLIAAIIFTLYYIFQGYFTYQFAEQIWKAVLQKKSQNEETEIIAEEKMAEASKPTESAVGQLRSNNSILKGLLPEMLGGPQKDLRAYLFDEMKTPKHFVHLSTPVVSLVRSILLSCVLVMLSARPLIQLTVALIVEIAYLVFIIKAVKLVSKIQFVAQIVGQILIGKFLILKLITVTANITEATRQKVLGYWMAWTLIAYALTGLVSMVCEACAFLIMKLKGCRKKKGKVFSVVKGKNNPESSGPTLDQSNEQNKEDKEQPSSTTRSKTKLL